MVKSKKKEVAEEQSIVFDPKARFKYITGFRKRKQARRKKAYIEDLEAERKDAIDVRREIRDEVKQRWKAVKNAEKRIDKILALRDKEGKNRRLALEGEVLDPIEDAVDSPSEEPLQMITFEQEDDDPFGGCEVTTTIPSGELSILGGDQSSRVLALADGPSEVPGEGDEEETALMVVPPEDPEVRARRRAENIAKAEAVRKKALAKKAVKLIQLKAEQKRKRGKKKNKRKGGKKKKTGAKARRKRK